MKWMLSCVLVCGLVAVSSGTTYQQSFILAIPVAPDYYYSVGDGLTPEQRAAAVAAVVVKKIEEKFSLGGEEGKALDHSLFNLSGSKQSNDGEVLSVLQANCMGCHKPGANRPGGVQLFTADRKLFNPNKAHRETVYESIRNGSMPKGRAPLSSKEQSLVRDWSK